MLKKSILLFVALLLILTMSACSSNSGGNQEQSQKPPTQEVLKETENEETTKEPTTDVPGTSISIYPGAQLVYSDDEQIVYATNASLDDLFKFYRGFSELKSGSASRADYGFFLETALIRIIRNVGDIQDEISKSGRLTHLMVLKADSDEINRVFNDEDIISQLPKDGNILQFRFWIN